MTIVYTDSRIRTEDNKGKNKGKGRRVLGKKGGKEKKEKLTINVLIMYE